jgi:pre-mRNA-splicing factor CWC26
LIIPDGPAPARASKESDATKTRAPKEGKMTDGTSTGLVSAAQVIMEAELKRKAERERLEKLTDEQSGRGAATNYRDKVTGKLLDEDERKRRAEGAKPKERERPVWAGGVEQARMAKQYAEDLIKAKDTPFAHADIDADYEDDQRKAMRFGDPMAHLSHKKRQAESLNLPSVVDGLGLSANDLKKSGFIIPQDVPAHSWIRRGLAAPHNRYGIKPGRHWDGVDRGTGFENKMFRKKNELKERAALEAADIEEHNEWF